MLKLEIPIRGRQLRVLPFHLGVYFAPLRGSCRTNQPHQPIMNEVLHCFPGQSGLRGEFPVDQSLVHVSLGVSTFIVASLIQQVGHI